MGLLHALDDMGHAPEVGRRPSEAADAQEAANPVTSPEPSTESTSRDEGGGGGSAGAIGNLGARLGGLLKGTCTRRGGRRHWSVWRVTAIAVLAYVVVVNLSYFFVLKPVWSQLDGLVTKKSVIQDFLVVRESAAAVSKFRDALMRGDQRVTVVTELEDFADEAGVRVLDDPVLGPVQEMSDHMIEYPIEMELSGDYHSLGRFLAMVEESPRALVTKSVEIRTDEEDPDTQTIRLKVGVVSWED
ncbi:MAG: type 4a pilus biogenesis protein PilO [Candidatus Eisenbacteria bacterium]|nr:type 4a pilus biogenesis protein PilO [Candidatus Eisenbacteria bacterium]